MTGINASTHILGSVLYDDSVVDEDLTRRTRHGVIGFAKSLLHTSVAHYSRHGQSLASLRVLQRATTARFGLRFR